VSRDHRGYPQQNAPIQIVQIKGTKVRRGTEPCTAADTHCGRSDAEQTDLIQPTGPGTGTVLRVSAVFGYASLDQKQKQYLFK